MGNNWQIYQWFDVERNANQALLSKCESLVKSGQCFDANVVQRLIVDTECPVKEFNMVQLVDQFNDLLHTLH